MYLAARLSRGHVSTVFPRRLASNSAYHIHATKPLSAIIGDFLFSQIKSKFHPVRFELGYQRYGRVVHREYLKLATRLPGRPACTQIHAVLLWCHKALNHIPGTRLENTKLCTPLKKNPIDISMSYNGCTPVGCLVIYLYYQK